MLILPALKSLRSRITWRVLWIVIASVLAIACFILLPKPAKPAGVLPDGTVLHLDWAAKGAHGTLVLGTPFQKTLWRWLGDSKLKRGLQWLKVPAPTTNTVNSTAGEGLLSFWFSITDPKQSGSQLYEYLRSQFLVEIVNRNGPNFTNKCYAGVTPDATLLFVRTLGPATNQPAAIRFLALDGTNWKTACEFPIAHLCHFSKSSTQ